MPYAILFDVLGCKPCFISKGLTRDEAAHADLPEFFLLRDDDGIDYFLGRSTEKSFDPLDRTMNSYGCTSILYRDEADQWVEL